MPLEVNGFRIDPEMIRSEAAALRQEARDAGHEVTIDDGLRFLEQATALTVEKTILEQEAARQSIRVDQMFAAWCKSIRKPRPKDLRDFYLNNRQAFWSPATILVSHIVKNVHHEDELEPQKMALNRVHETLEAGARFAETADAHSDCPGNGGQIGYIKRGEMVPEFEEVVFSAPLGKITPVFPTRFGFHIALVWEILPEGILPFEKVASTIERAMIEQKRNEVIAERVERLRSHAVIRQVSSA